MRILMIVAHPEIHGPIPKLNLLMRQGLEALGVDVFEAPYCRRLPTQAKAEPFLRKVLDRTDDLKTLVARARTVRPDLIFVAHTTQDLNSILRDLPLVLMNQLLHIPMVFLYHGSRAQELDTNWRLRFVSKVMFSMTDGLFLLSQEELPFFEKYWPHYPFACVPYPAVTSARDGAGLPSTYPAHWQDENLPVLLFIGRLVAPKGIQELIESMPLMLQGARCRLAVLGEGQLLEPLRDRIREQGLEAFVHFAGYVEDQHELNAWYQASDVFVLPTYWREGFPVVILEAMANGLPIVCTKIRGVADYLQEGVNALFVPDRDPGTLASQLTKLVEDETGRSRMSLANRALIKEFDPCRVMRKYLAFFERVLANANPLD